MRYSVKKLCYMALLTAVSLAMFVIELQLPSFPMFPAAKIGLANIITLFVLFLGGGWKIRDAAVIMLLRVALGALVTGRVMAGLFSLVGGILALLMMITAKKLLNNNGIPIVSLCGAVGHNIGQMLVACLFYGGFGALYYLPLFLLCGIAGGLLTGFCVHFIYRSQKRLIAKISALE